MSGNLFGHILMAKEQFAKDLLTDKDYLEYRKTSHEYGTVNIYNNYYRLCNDISSVDLIKQYIKQYKIKI